MFSGPKLLVTLVTVGVAVIYFLIASGKLVRFLEKLEKKSKPDRSDPAQPDSAQPDSALPVATELELCPKCGAHTVMPCKCGV